MVERTEILSIYRQWMIDRWRDRQMTLDEVHDLKVFCATHSITPEEHESIASELSVPTRELMDEDNQTMIEWLHRRSEAANPMRTVQPEPVSPWTRNLPPPPTPWQNRLAVMAIVIILVGILLFVIAL